MRCARSLSAAAFSAAFVLGGAVSPLIGATLGTSCLCTEVSQECELPGTAVVLAVKVQSHDAQVVGAQFTIEFDPSDLQLVQISPGSECDATSPYSVEIFRDVDASIGKVFYGVGMPTPGLPPDELTAIACITFLPRKLGQTDVCVINDANPRLTILANSLGDPVPIDNSKDCPPGVGQNGLACTTMNVTETCTCTSGGDECAILDSDCRVGVCHSATGVCGLQSANEGSACDDGELCTNDDRCAGGICRGTGCNNPSLCLSRLNCPGPGQLHSVAMVLGEGEPLISAGQFSIMYDPAKLELVNVQPGSACDPDSPFSVELGRKHDPAKGTLFYAAGIGVEDTPTAGPAVIACLYFRTLAGFDTEVCSFSGLNPFTTTLADENGQRVGIYNVDACPTEQGFPIMSCVQFEFCRIPAVSDWGLVALVLMIAIVGKISFAAMGRAPAR